MQKEHLKKLLVNQFNTDKKKEVESEPRKRALRLQAAPSNGPDGQGLEEPS
jgi:hypothetical protein